MKTFILTAAAFILIAGVEIHTASALMMDQTSGTNKDGSSKFDDPDDKIPFPHVADDGTPPSSNFQAQPVGNTGMSFSLTPSNGESDAFQRAQENRQQ